MADPDSAGSDPTPDPTGDLQRMADLAEGSATPLPAAQVRALGDRRRGRRSLLTAGVALVTLLIVGGAVFTGLVVFRGSGQLAGPPVTGTPSASEPSTAPSSSTSSVHPHPTTPARTVTEKNLLSIEDVPLEDYVNQAAVIVKDGVGRPVAESSVCLPPTGLTGLGASAEVHRNFRFSLLEGKPEKGYPFTNQPVIYTQALQFGSKEEATKARETYLGWFKACPALLKQKGYQVLPHLGFDPTKLHTQYGNAIAAELAYRRPGGADGENAIWESVGLTVVGDRMMVTVFIHWGMEFELTIDTSEGDLLHPQIGLTDSASMRLKE